MFIHIHKVIRRLMSINNQAMRKSNGFLVIRASYLDGITLEQYNYLFYLNSPTEMIYTYDANRNLETIRGTNKPWFNQDFIYDPSNRLNDAVGAYGTYSYSYDNVGNRLTKTAYGQTEAYTYITGTNKIDEVTGPNQTIGYGYDNNGNITTVGDRTLIYNQTNRLVRVEKDSTVIGEYKYNGSGQRVKKTVDGATTIFHYDFDGKIIGESLTDGSFKKEYLYTSYTPKAMVDTTSGELYFFLNDYLGTPQMLVDSINTIVWEATYKLFSEAFLNSKSLVEDNFRVADHYYDKETGLHYNYFRY